MSYVHALSCNFRLQAITFRPKLIAFALFFASADFSGPNPGVVTFLAGDGPGTFRSTVFNVVNDNILELDETILISGTSLSPLGQFQAGGETTVIAITDDDHGRC